MKKKNVLSLLVTLLTVLSLGGLMGRVEARSSAKPATVLEGVVNVNTASAEELSKLPGIGPSKAQAIIALRQAHPFKAVSELAEVKGIGPKKIEKIKDHVTVSGPTTLVVKPSAAVK